MDRKRSMLSSVTSQVKTRADRAMDTADVWTHRRGGRLAVLQLSIGCLVFPSALDAGGDMASAVKVSVVAVLPLVVLLLDRHRPMPLWLGTSYNREFVVVVPDKKVQPSHLRRATKQSGHVPANHWTMEISLIVLPCYSFRYVLLESCVGSAKFKMLEGLNFRGCFDPCFNTAASQ